MGELFSAPTRPKAAKQHQCVACLHAIAEGEVHFHQTGFYDGRAFRNRYHDECWKVLSEEGAFEFIPGDLEPPDRLTTQHPEGGDGR